MNEEKGGQFGRLSSRAGELGSHSRSSGGLRPPAHDGRGLDAHGHPLSPSRWRQGAVSSLLAKTYPPTESETTTWVVVPTELRVEGSARIQVLNDLLPMLLCDATRRPLRHRNAPLLQVREAGLVPLSGRSPVPLRRPHRSSLPRMGSHLYSHRVWRCGLAASQPTHRQKCRTPWQRAHTRG